MAAILLATACSSGSTVADEAPTDTAANNGLPIHWIEAPPDGLAREYYEGVLHQEGNAERGDIPREVRGLLTTSQAATGTRRSYEFSEYRIELDVVHRLIGTTTASGDLMTSGTGSGAVVYTLAGAMPSGRPRVFVRLYDSLYVPSSIDQPTAIIGTEKLLEYVATASKGRVEISDGLRLYPHWRIRLRVGDELVARLAPARGNRWALIPETVASALRHEDGPASSGEHQAFAFKAVAAGETELAFRHVDANDDAVEYCCPYKARIRIE